MHFASRQDLGEASFVFHPSAGERFMAMFNDSDDDRSRKAKGGARRNQTERKPSSGSKRQAEAPGDGACVVGGAGPNRRGCPCHTS